MWYTPCVLWAVTLWLWVRAGWANPQRETLEYSIVEGLGAETRIGNIQHDAGIDLKYDRQVLSQLHYLFLTTKDPAKQYFIVLENNGALMTRIRIDRETLCEPRAPVCQVDFDIAIRPVPVDFLEVVSVRITIKDVNDNAPIFPKPSIVLAISENVMPGASFVIPAAHDPDSGSLGIQHYDFVSSNTLFELRKTNTSDGTVDLRLILREKLDRELQTSYNMRVIARDGGVPSKSGTLNINVTVTDANDNSPVFERASYDAQVEEDAAQGTAILRVHATDPDMGPSGKVVYGLAPDTKTEYGNLFAVDNRTGDVYLIGKLDYEVSQIYNLLVTATDMGPGAVPTHARVVIHVRDVNDHSPIIMVNALSNSGEVEIPENAEPGHFVAHISIEDEDGGRNGEVSCGISDDHYFAIQKIYKNEYKIITADSFNREQMALYRLLLECHDHGDYSRRSTVDMYVRVLDVNDNPPVFSQEIYIVNFQENNTRDARILTVNASDRDVGANGRMTFRIAEDARNKVSVDSATGVIRAIDVFDYEKMHSFRFAVTVEDNGEPAFTSTATVLLNLLDINDQQPVFQDSSYSFATLENEPAGTQLGSVFATDQDDTPFDQVQYSLRASQDSKDFTIDGSSGRLSTKTSLDREYKDRYTVYVVAGNPGYPRLTSVVPVTINVADVNDNAPLISYPTRQNYTLQISNRMPAGHLVTRVQAKDMDDGVNAALSYSLAKGNDRGLFEIDQDTGVITVASDLHQMDQQNFDLIIMTTDKGDPQRSANADLVIYVNSSVPFKDSHALKATSPFGTGVNNRTIVISLAAATVILILILILALVCIKRKQHRGKRDEYRYMCQVDLTQRRPPSAKDGPDSDNPDAEPMPRPMPLPPPPRQEPETLRKEVRFNVLPDGKSEDKEPSPTHWPGDMPQETQVPVRLIFTLKVLSIAYWEQYVTLMHR